VPAALGAIENRPILGSKVDLKSSEWKGGAVNCPVLPSRADLHRALVQISDYVGIDVLAKRHNWNLAPVAGECDAAMGINHAGHAQAEDILGRRVRLQKGERAEEAVATAMVTAKRKLGLSLGMEWTWWQLQRSNTFR
jgi:hypothetical protein